MTPDNPWLREHFRLNVFQLPKMAKTTKKDFLLDEDRITELEAENDKLRDFTRDLRRALRSMATENAQLKEQIESMKKGERV